MDILPELLREYNNTKHSSIKMTPVEASKKKNENLVYLNLYSGSASKECSHKFAIRDRVRISEFKRKGF